MRRLRALGRHGLLLLAIGAGQLVATAAIAFLTGALIADLGAGAGVSSAELALLAAAAAAATALCYAERVQGEASAQKVVHDMRVRLARHLLRLPPGEAARAERGYLLRFTGDLSAVRTWHARGVPGLLIGVPAVCGGLAALLVLDWRVGLAGAGLFAAGLGLQVLLAPRLRSSARIVRRRRSRVFQAAAEASQSLASIQLFGRSAAHLRRTERRSAALAAALNARARWSGLVRATGDLAATGLPVAMIALWQATGAGDAGAVGAALAVGALVSPRLRELARIREYRELASVSEARIASFLARPPLELRRSAPRLRSGRGRLELRGLALPGILERATVEAPAGSRIALAGPNGAGKSRLLGVIAGLEAPAAGHVAIDGERVDGRRLASLRQAVALAGPAMPLVDGSVSRNIRYGMRASDDACAAILELCGYERLVAVLPDGPQTRVGPGGRRLSPGQRARVGLIRALLRRPRLLLLDGIDEALDAEGRAVLRRVLDAFEGKVLLATHDPGLAAGCGAAWRIAGREIIVESSQEVMACA